MMELYTVHPPRLQPIDVWARNAAEARHLAAAWWRYGGSLETVAVDPHPQNDEAALAGATAQDGKPKCHLDPTTPGACGQHRAACAAHYPDCPCNTCAHDQPLLGALCCVRLHGSACPVTRRCAYYEREAPPC